jgi:hypothetical protein
MAKISTVHSNIAGRNVRALAIKPEQEAAFAQGYQHLRKLGFEFHPEALEGMLEAHGFDASDMAPVPLAGVTTPTIPGLVQFLQAWLPGFVRVLTAPRVADELLGIQTVGAWEDEEVVQGILEGLGTAVPYTDHGNVPLSSWNVNYERRTVLRFESGLEVGRLEELRSARIRVSTSAEKRTSAAEALDILRNRIAFFGYNSGTNRTFGMLNEPNLSAYVSVAATGTGGNTEWSTKTYLQIQGDLRVMIQGIRVSTKGRINPSKDALTLVLPTSAIDFLSVTSEFGNSVWDWLRESYPKLRIESAPEFDAANGGENVAYIYAESIADGGSDGGNVWAQLVPTKFFALGVEKRVKTYVEDFANATAGVLLKRPFAVNRYTGL